MEVDMVNILKDGSLATFGAASAGGVGSIFVFLRVWRAFRKELGDAGSEKRQEEFNKNTMNRADYLEKQLDEMRKQYSEQSIALGVARGEAGAFKMQSEELTRSKEEWKARAQAAETHNAELEGAVSTLSAHLFQTQMWLSAEKGEIDKSNLGGIDLPSLPKIVQEKLTMAFRIAGDTVRG